MERDGIAQEPLSGGDEEDVGIRKATFQNLARSFSHLSPQDRDYVAILLWLREQEQ